MRTWLSSPPSPSDISRPSTCVCVHSRSFRHSCAVRPEAAGILPHPKRWIRNMLPRYPKPAQGLLRPRDLLLEVPALDTSSHTWNDALLARSGADGSGGD